MILVTLLQNDSLQLAQIRTQNQHIYGYNIANIFKGSQNLPEVVGHETIVKCKFLRQEINFTGIKFECINTQLKYISKIWFKLKLDLL